MKWSKLLILFVMAGLGVACSDDNPKEQDPELDMDLVINQDLYYNPWLNNKDAYTREGMVEVIRFSGDRKLWNVDFGGKQETLLGTWTADVKENTLDVAYEDGKNETWHVLDWEKGVFTVMVDGGKREYVSGENKEVAYLQELTGDAFLLTEIEQRGSKTMLRIMLEGKNIPNIINAEAILSEEQSVSLKPVNKAMVEEETIDASLLGMPEKERDVIFYVNAGKGKEFKFADRIYADALGKKDFSAFDLRGRNTSNELTIIWKNPYSSQEAYYQVEVMSDDEKKTYFMSDYLGNGTSQLKVDNTTKCMDGYTNEMRTLFSAVSGSVNFKLRLSVILLEPGIDINSKCSYVNRQSVTKVTSRQVWN